MSCVDSLCRCFQNAIAKVEAGEDDGWAFADTLGCVFLFAYLVLYHLWAGFKYRKAIRKDANYWVKKNVQFSKAKHDALRLILIPFMFCRRA